MSRIIKALGLAMVAAFALSAMTASAAHAVKGPAAVTIESGTGFLDGDQGEEESVLTRQVRRVTCEVATYDAHAVSGDTTIRIDPNYAECHSFIGPATVTMESCYYMFHLDGEEVPNEEDLWTATATLECENAGDEVEVHIYTSHTNHTSNTAVCRYRFPEQAVDGHINLTNIPAGGETPEDWIHGHIEVEGITSYRNGGTGGVITCGTNEDSAGELEGEAVLKGTDEEEEPTGITISTHD
jgi:hypothetical protein